MSPPNSGVKNHAFYEKKRGKKAEILPRGKMGAEERKVEEYFVGREREKK